MIDWFYLEYSGLLKHKAYFWIIARKFDTFKPSMRTSDRGYVIPFRVQLFVGTESKYTSIKK